VRIKRVAPVDGFPDGTFALGDLDGEPFYGNDHFLWPGLLPDRKSAWKHPRVNLRKMLGDEDRPECAALAQASYFGNGVLVILFSRGYTLPAWQYERIVRCGAPDAKFHFGETIGLARSGERTLAIFGSSVPEQDTIALADYFESLAGGTTNG
jgi:hypothetical protein